MTFLWSKLRWKRWWLSVRLDQENRQKWQEVQTTLKWVSNIWSVSQDADFSIILDWSISLTTAVQMWIISLDLVYHAIYWLIAYWDWLTHSCVFSWSSVRFLWTPGSVWQNLDTAVVGAEARLVCRTRPCNMTSGFSRLQSGLIFWILSRSCLLASPQRTTRRYIWSGSSNCLPRRRPFEPDVPHVCQLLNLKKKNKKSC